MSYKEYSKKLATNTSFIYIPVCVGDEIFDKSWADIIRKKIKHFQEQKNSLPSLTSHSYKLPIGKIPLNEKAQLDLSLESFSTFEENWNTDNHSPPDLPIKLCIKFSIDNNTDWLIPPSFSRKKDRSHKNLELESLLNYTLVKLPVTGFLKYIESNQYTKFKAEIANV